MIERALLIGYGEVGKAHFDILKEHYKGRVFYKDKGEEIYDTEGRVVNINAPFDLLMIATQCDPGNMEPFYEMVQKYDEQFTPDIIDILTTTPCGTCDELQKRFGPYPVVTKSSTRGMHGGGIGISFFLTKIPKHIGGKAAFILKEFYEEAGFPCIVHSQARAPELFHALTNSDYGVNIMKAQENYNLCRHFGVSYVEYMKYSQSNNDGFIEAGYPDKVKPILTPPMGPLGGHCVVYSATTFPEKIRGPLMDLLAKYNDKFKAPVKSDIN